MSCSTRIAPPPPARRDGRRARDEYAGHVAAKRQLVGLDAAAPQGRGQLRRDVGMPDHLEIAASDGGRVDRQHLLGSAVHELHAPLAIQHEDAFDHPGEDRFHVRAVAGKLLEPPPEVLYGRIERARHRSQLVAAVVVGRAGQIARAVSLRDGGHRLHPPAEDHRRQPGEQHRQRRRQRERNQRVCANPPRLIGDGGERQSHANVRDLGMTRGHGRVQQIRPNRGAVPFDDANTSLACNLNLGPIEVVLERGERLTVHARITHHDAVATDQRHAPVDGLGKAIRFVIDAWSADAGVLCQQIGDQHRLVAQPPLDDRSFLAPQFPRGDRRREGKGRRGDTQGGREDLAAEPDGHDASSSRSL